ncbi:MAG TPA: NUDIX hydrolase [Burkholderiaceae bacterium]|nr:NUDIX hydrolase [Burkholderiaceae bacterium]
MPEIKTLSSKIVYENRWMKVREDAIERADGTRSIYGVVEKPDFAVVAAVQDDVVYLVEQYRYPAGARYWELPQGSWGSGSGGADELARTELREETGIVAASWQHVGRLHEAYGYAIQSFDVFLATGLTFGAQELEAEELGLVCKGFGVAAAIEMIRRGVITDAVTVAAFGLLKMKDLV